MPEAAAVCGDAGGVAAGLSVEGRAMLGALLCDGLRADDLELTLLLDGAVTLPLPPGVDHDRVTVIRVPEGDERRSLAAAAAGADWTLIVAPETDGILADRVAVPAGCLLPAGERLPDAFRRPAVAKALDRCGGDGLVVVPRGADLPPAPLPRRVEAFVAGVPVGVSCLCGPAEMIALPPVRQRFSTGIHPGYLGGDLQLGQLLEYRAMALARRALRGLGRSRHDPRRSGRWM